MNDPAAIPIQQLCRALLDAETRLKPRYLYRFSDLEAEDLDQLRSIWTQIPLWRRQALLEDISALSEQDTLLDFKAFCRLAAEDPDDKVRLLAVQTLDDYEDKSLVQLLLRFLRQDQTVEVRAAAASGLGKYVYAGELDEIPARMLHEIEEALLAVVQGQDDPRVRRAALESLGYSSREEVAPLIAAAYANAEKEWVASALFAMGRSANPDWEPQVLAKLDSPYPLVRAEAAQAAGELELSEALPRLLELLDDPDEATRSASIWSLSQIGGEGVRQALEKLYKNADTDEEADFLESALDNLAFSEGSQSMALFDFSDLQADEEEWDDFDDLEDGFEDLLDDEEDEDF